MRAHISLNVKDIPQSIGFYRKLFGVEPQKQTASYAKFDLLSPALNFSLASGAGDVSRVSHLGVEVDSPAELKEWEDRLVRAGLKGEPELQTKCCFARQDKLWFQDPDGNHWEVFYVYEQLPVTEPQWTSSCCK